MTDLGTIIGSAAQRYGQDPAALSREAQIESSMNPNAHNASGASGLFQFVPSTAAHYGLADPYDPVASADAAARLMRDNSSYLTKMLGRQPTGGELYLAHQQGAGGASKLLSNPDAPAASLVGASAIRANGGSADMTAGQFANLWTSKFDKTQPTSGNGGGSLGALYASGNLPSLSGGATQYPALTSATINPAAVLASQLGTDDAGAPVMPQRPATVANGGAAAAEAKRRALITGTGGLGALFA